MICQQCGKVNDPDAVFCVQCSQPLLHSCPACSTQNSVDASFCKKCGTALDDASTAGQSDRLQSLKNSAPETLQEKLRKSETEIEGQRKPVTILFADIVGSTSIAEKLDPEEWKEVVQGAHQRVSEAIHRYEGTIAQLLGDGVMAFFGAPLTHEDDPERAVRAGLDLQKSIKAYARELAGFVDDFHMRVGIHTGEVVVGAVGSDEHTEYLAIGDAVNTAARVESAATPGHVLVSKACAAHVLHAFEFDDFNPIQAKGKSEPLQAAIVRSAKVKPGLARGLGGQRSPFVGRENELAQVEAALQALCQGQGQIVILLGEAGIGKTRLLEEARQRSCSAEAGLSTTYFDPRSLNWLEGRALSYGSSLSFWTINQLLLNDLGLSDGAPRVKIKAALRKRIVELFGEEDTPRVLPYLTHLLDLSQEGPEGELLKHMDGEAIKYQTLIYLKDYFEHVARQAPTVLVLEDLNWADPSSLEALEKLLPLTDRVPLMFALLMRVDREHGAWDLKTAVEKDLPHRSTVINLHRLANEESQALVDQLLGADSLPNELRGLIFSRSEGNPFYLEEVVRHLLESGWLKEVDGKYIAPEGIGEIGIPETLQGVLLARIDRLDQDVRATLQMASVIGKSFLFKLLQAIAEAERKLETHLSQLQQVDLVREKTRLPELEYIFKHSLTQEAAYNSLLVERRKAFHRMVGEAMEQLFPDRQDEFLGLLSHHFQAAGELDKAAEYLIRAGDKARLADAQDEAVGLYRAALPILEEKDDPMHRHALWLRIGLSLHMDSKYKESKEAYRQAYLLNEAERQVELKESSQTNISKKELRTLRFRYRSTHVSSFDPGIATGAYEIPEACFSGLTRIDDRIGVKPHLARAWDVSEDGKTYRFHLRDDAHWTDGTKVTADQFEWTWKRNMSPEINSFNSFLFDDIVGAHEYRTGQIKDAEEVGVRALDPLTLEVCLRSPANYFLYITSIHATYPLPRWVIEKFGDDWWRPEHIVSNGPFRFERFDETGFTIIRDPDYFAASRGNLKRIIGLMLDEHDPDLSAERYFSDYKSGIIDVFPISSANVSLDYSQPEIVKKTSDTTQFLFLNSKLTPLDDILIRSAIAQALDIGEIQSNHPLGSPATGGLVHPRTPGHSPNINVPSNLEAAQKALQDAGYPMGDGFPELLLRPQGEYILSAGYSIASQFEEKLGIKINVLSPATDLEWHQCHLRIGGWFPDYPDPDSILRLSTSPEFCRHGKYEKKLESLFSQAWESLHRKKRLSLYREIDSWLVADEIIFIPLFYSADELYIQRPTIKDLSPNFNNLENVIIEDGY